MKRFGLILLRVFTAFDWPLLAILLMFAALGLTVMHSAVAAPTGASPTSRAISSSPSSPCGSWR